MNVRPADAVRNAILNALRDFIDSGSGPGYFEIRDGTQPANANLGATGTLLATLTFSDPCASNASSGTLTFNSITGDNNVDNSGTASWGRAYNSSGQVAFDFDVTASGGGGTLQLNSVSLVAGGTVIVTAFTLTQPAS